MGPETARPLVSVIIIVKNGERFLTAAIQSVLRSDYRPIEIIVVDGGSVDRTAEIARSFELVRYVLQGTPGIAAAYNLGVESARGEYVAFLSHDDLWAPHKLSRQVDYLEQHPVIQYTVTRVRFFLEPGYAIPPGFKPELLEGDHVGRIMETLVARRSLFDLIGAFDTTIALPNDVDWFARAKDRGIPMAVIPEVLLEKRIHDANSTGNARLNSQELLRVLKRSIDRQRESPPAGGPPR